MWWFALAAGLTLDGDQVTRDPVLARERLVPAGLWVRGRERTGASPVERDEVVGDLDEPRPFAWRLPPPSSAPEAASPAAEPRRSVPRAGLADCTTSELRPCTGVVRLFRPPAHRVLSLGGRQRVPQVLAPQGRRP